MHIHKTMDNGVVIAEYDGSEKMAAAIADMWNKSNDSWGGGSQASTPEQVAANFAGGSYFNIFTAMYNDEAVGLATFDRYWADADTAYVHVLNVRPDYHGKKVGKELVLMCVEKTIEMGLPRLDIHTWPGNVKAVPLYKKCGFLWEDRADTTHLSNFIPTVLKTELFGGFFKTADWYNDSSRVIEISPDGVKVNKFEVYGYSWKSGGKNLSVGFEKTGRRIRYIETDDYKIELMAQNHELAFGLNYNCTFKIQNKSGAELNIKITGKNDKGIKFDFAAEENIKGTKEFNAEFYVEPVTEEIDIWRMHPCVLADIYVNGQHAELGLGIEPKFPLIAGFTEKRNFAKPGISEEVYINIKSALQKKASVKFLIPENSMTRFAENDFALEISPDKTVMLKTTAEILACGYAKADVEYNIELEDGNKITFSKPLHLINQGFGGAFSFELEHEYSAVNGLYKLTLYKRGGHANFYKFAGHGSANFHIPKLGKPYSDEFDLLKPSDVRIYNKEHLTVFEADYESAEYKGIILTLLFEFDASGIVHRRSRVKNNSNQTYPLFLQESCYTSAARRSVFCYDGEIHEIKDNNTYGFSDLHPEKITENWIFDDSVYNKSGMYWDKSYKPHTKWGDELVFEHDLGNFGPGAVFETKPFVYITGVFHNFREFRNYVLGIHEETTPHTVLPLDISINGRNPFIGKDSANIQAVITNHRIKMLAGEIALSSPDGLFGKSVQTNPDEEITAFNTFDMDLNKIKPGVYTAELEFKFKGWEKTQRRALFVSDDSGIKTEEKDEVFTVTNGGLCFKASPEYSDALYSLKYNGDEWLFSQYPEIKPYSWQNPFIGGMQAQLWSMNNNLILREKINAEFVLLNDNFGNEWTGIKTTVKVNEFEEHKGMVYEQFYLTRPSLPVLCYFVRLANNTGGYKHIGYNMSAYLSDKENLSDIYAFARTNEKDEYRVRMGEGWTDADRFIRISHERANPRAEKLYVYADAPRNNGNISIHSNINECSVYSGGWVNLKNNEAHNMRPLFFVITEKEFAAESFEDLSRIIF